jgi:hypothetical protein
MDNAQTTRLKHKDVWGMAIEEAATILGNTWQEIEVDGADPKKAFEAAHDAVCKLRGRYEQTVREYRRVWRLEALERKP